MLKSGMLWRSPGVWCRDQWRGIPYGRKYAFFSTFVLGLLTHLYMFANLYLNSDGIAVLSRTLHSAESGRWFQAWLTNLSGTLNGPWINGILSLLYLSLAVALLVDLFDIRSRLYITLLGAVVVTFPAMATLYAYMYTADGIAATVLLSVLGAWLVRRSRWGILPGVLCMVLSLAVYQCYLSFAAALFVLLLVLDLLRPGETFRRVLRRGLWYVLSLVLSLTVYYVTLRVSMHLRSYTLTNYQGINNLGAITLDKLPELLAQCYVRYVAYFTDQAFGVFARALKGMNLGLMVGTLASGVFLAARGRLWRRPLMLALYVALLLLFPLAANAVYLLTAAGTTIYSLLLFPMVMAYVLCVVLLYRVDLALREMAAQASPGSWARLPVAVACWVQIVLLALVSYNSFIEINGTYVKAQVELQQTVNYSAGLLETIEDDPEYEVGMPIFRVGSSAVQATFPEVRGSFYFFMGHSVRPMLLSGYSYSAFAQVYFGKEMSFLQYPDLDTLDDETYRQAYALPVYPAEGCTRVIEGVLYVKLGDIPPR